ncbi:hypothetical protein OROMI_030722 [Orobanche minor]
MACHLRCNYTHVGWRGACSLEHLVYVKSGPVHCTIPSRFKSYQKFRGKIGKQRRQLCDVVDSIVEKGPKAPEQKSTEFSERIYYVVRQLDLHSMLFYPYIVQDRLPPIYFIASRLLMCYPKITFVTFDAIIKGHQSEFGGSASNQQSWVDNVKDSNKQELKRMLNTRLKAGGYRKEYDPIHAATTNTSIILGGI